MKYTLVLLLLISYSCQSEQHNSLSYKKIDKTEQLERKEKPNPNFEDYRVEDIIGKIDEQTIDKIYDLNKPHFEQFNYAREEFEKYSKVFADKYIGIDISQGSETVVTYFFDYQTGEMYESPLFMYSADYKENSRLYIKDPILDKRQQEECKSGIYDCDTKYYVWNENKKIFEEIK